MNQPKSPDDNPASSLDSEITQQANNSTFGGGQQGTIGESNIQNQGNNNLLGNTWNIFLGQQTTPVGNPARPKNENYNIGVGQQTVASVNQNTPQQKILILAAIPHGLRLDREIREIEEAIRRAIR
ncbi:hypothetical protein NIES2109_56910 (plasmid) [Nostoc sp. HK-01]|nr:hypothetical protein NIES2109_56910 [Nostoc sp. HK-01]